MTSTKYIIVSNRRVSPGDQIDIEQRQDFNPDKLKIYGKLDYIFIPFWSWWIPPSIYKKWTCVIFHMTDLRNSFGRGGSPLLNLIIKGFDETKISAIKCVKGIDAGPVYCQVPLRLEGTADDIYDRADNIIRTAMIPFICKQRPEPSPQRGKPVYFERWKCSKEDVVRAISSDYEW
jgi:methionyl-tRNA formyltransferase